MLCFDRSRPWEQVPLWVCAAHFGAQWHFKALMDLLQEHQTFCCILCLNREGGREPDSCTGREPREPRHLGDMAEACSTNRFPRRASRPWVSTG